MDAHRIRFCHYQFFIQCVFSVSSLDGRVKEMERYTPIFVDISGKSCCVVGGGRVAERKIKGLLHAQAQI
ncbi:NAD(P)-dependent oxidoreductase, partial [Bacillus subtilis]|uniref:NAD(P)-dependent oxidoreductase n=1 Tax=Bacillus subtilis TaxID=1423 RepID=UPI003F7CBF84